MSRADVEQTGIPWTVLGGYLGSGKTTLINRVLHESVDERIAIIVNDFGAVNVDADLIRAQHGDVLELANGCMCCDLSGGMGAVMDDLSPRRNQLDHVLVEVSGVGDPGPVAAWGDYDGFRRGGVLVCADAEAVEVEAADRWVGDTVRTQLHSADLVLLTKTDLMRGETVHETVNWLHATFPGVPVATTDGVSASTLLGMPEASISQGAKPKKGYHARHQTLALTGTVTLERAVIKRRLANLPSGVVRAKGFVRPAESAERACLVQVVGRRQILADAGLWDSDRVGGLVIILSPGADSDAITQSVLKDWPELLLQNTA